MSQKVFVAVGIPLNRDEVKRMQTLVFDGPSNAFEGYSPTIVSNYLCFDVWIAGGNDFALMKKTHSFKDLDDTTAAAQAVATRFHLSLDHQIIIYVDGVLTYVDQGFVFGLAYRFPETPGDVTGPGLRSRGIPVENAPALEYIGGVNFGAFKFLVKAKLDRLGLYHGWTWERDELETAEEDWDLYLPYGSQGGPKGGTEWLAMFEVVKSGLPIQQFRSIFSQMQDVLRDITQKLTGTFGIGLTGLILWHAEGSDGDLPLPPLDEGRERPKKTFHNPPVNPTPANPPKKCKQIQILLQGDSRLRKGRPPAANNHHR